MNFTTLSDILYIFQYSIIQVCGTISLAHLLSIHKTAKFFSLVFSSSSMCWFTYSRSSVSLVPLWYPFYSSRNSPQANNFLSCYLFIRSFNYVLSVPIFILKFFCFLSIWLLVCSGSFSTDMLVECFFVILNGPVLFGFISVSFKFSFIHLYLLIFSPSCQSCLLLSFFGIFSPCLFSFLSNFAFCMKFLYLFF